MSSLFPSRRIERVFLPLGTMALLLGLWAAGVKLSGTHILPSPVQVVSGAGELISKHVLLADIRDSLRRVSVGFSLAVLLGVPLGLILGWKPAINDVVNPVMQLLRPISPIAWIPIAILLFGVRERGAIFLIFLGAFFPIVVTSTDGVRGVPALYHRAGQNFGLSSGQLLLRVLLPAAMPRILSGLRIALGIAWLVVVAAEMVAVDSGLGFLVIDSRNSGKRYDLVIAAMLAIGLIGLLLDLCFRALERIPSFRWGFNAT